jgi:hypothetical protein
MRKAIRPRCPSKEPPNPVLWKEAEHQRELIKMCRADSTLKNKFCASANGAFLNSPAQWAFLHSTGVETGFPDLQFFIRTERFIGLFIELKSLSPTALFPSQNNRPEQYDWLMDLGNTGYLSTSVKGYEAAWELLNAHRYNLELPKNKNVRYYGNGCYGKPNECYANSSPVESSQTLLSFHLSGDRDEGHSAA